MFAPTLPFATEEAWSWSHDGSIHATRWPEATAAAGDAALELDTVSDVLGRVRRAKTEAKRSQRSAVARVVVHAPEPATAAVAAARDDLVDALTVGEFELNAGDELTIDVQLD